MGKKFVSLCIAFLMLFGIFVQNYGGLQVYADGSSEIVKTIWDPAKWTSGVLTKTGTSSVSNNEMDNGSTVRKTAWLPGAAMIGATAEGNVYANDEDRNAGNVSLKLDTNVFQINYNTAFADDLTAYPVFDLSYKMYIPADENKDKLRSLTIPIGNKALCNPVVKFENGKATVTQSGTSLDVDSAYTKEYTYSAGEWIPVEVKAYFKSGSKLSIGVYVGNELIFHGYRTSGNLTDTTAAQIGTTQMKWESYYETVNADNNEYKFVTTYLDDIKISLLTENQKPLPDTYVTYFDFDYSQASGDPQISGTNNIVARSVKHTKNAYLVHSTNYTNNVSPVAITDETATDHWMDFYSYDNRGTESEPDYVLSTWVKPDTESDGELDMLQNFRGNIETYTTQTEDSELVLSYDIFIPEGTEQNERIHSLTFNGTANSESNNTSEYIIRSKILGGKLSFETNTSEPGNLLLKRSDEVLFTSGEWHTVTYVLKLHYDSTANSYDIMIYGVYNGERIFGEKVTLACSTATTTAGALRIIQQRIRIFSFAGGTDFETKYDNLKLVYYPAGNRYDNPSWSETNYAYPILLTNTGDGKVNAKARLEGYDDGVLVVAFYNNSTDKKLISVKTVSDRSGENSEYLELSSLAIPDGSSYVRAFLLNDLSKMTPYTLSSDITIE